MKNLRVGLAVVFSLAATAELLGAQTETCKSVEGLTDGRLACCLVGGKDVGNRTLVVHKTADAFTDAPVFQVAGFAAKRMIILTQNGEEYNVSWVFNDTEPVVFIIDDEHKMLPGVVRFGKLEARNIQWVVSTKTTIRTAISREEFQAAKNGVALRVSNTWLQPQYKAVPDFSCSAAWEFVAAGKK